MKEEMDYISDLFVDELGDLELTPPDGLGPKIIDASQAGLFPRMWLNVWVKAIFELVILLSGSLFLIAYTSKNDTNTMQYENSEFAQSNSSISNTYHNKQETITPISQLAGKDLEGDINNTKHEIQNTGISPINETQANQNDQSVSTFENGIPNHQTDAVAATASIPAKDQLAQQASTEIAMSEDIVVPGSVDDITSVSETPIDNNTDKTTKHINDRVVLNMDGQQQASVPVADSDANQFGNSVNSLGLNRFESESMYLIQTMEAKSSYVKARALNSPDMNHLKSDRRDEQNFNRLQWSLKVFGGKGTPGFSAESTDNEAKPVLQSIRNSIGAGKVEEFGFEIQAQHKHLIFESGLGQSIISWNEIYSLSDINIKNSSYFQVFENFETIVDTVDSYLSISGNDTSTAFLTNTFQQAYWDSTELERIDTAITHADTLLNNELRYIELPLIFGYSFHAGSVQLISKTGIIGGIVTHMQGGSYYGSENTDGRLFINKDFAPVKLDLYVGMEARYPLRKRLFIFGDLYYRRNINQFYSRQNISRKVDQLGLRAGIGINF